MCTSTIFSWFQLVLSEEKNNRAFGNFWGLETGTVLAVLVHKSTRMWWQSMNCTPKTTTATVTCHQLLQTSAKTTKSQQSDGKVECMPSPVKQPKFDFHQVTKSVTSSWGCSIGASIFTYTCFSSRIPVATTVFCEVLFGHLPALVSVLCSQLSTNRKTVHVSVCLYW